MATVSVYDSPAEATSSVSVFSKVLATLSLAGIAIVHILDLGGKLSETPYLGYAYIILIAGAILAIGLILGNRRSGWVLGGAFALGAIIAYVLSRTTGLPNATDDVGNWLEPLGVWALVCESVMVVLSGYVLGRNRAHQQ